MSVSVYSIRIQNMPVSFVSYILDLPPHSFLVHPGLSSAQVKGHLTDSASVSAFLKTFPLLSTYLLSRDSLLVMSVSEKFLGS